MAPCRVYLEQLQQHSQQIYLEQQQRHRHLALARLVPLAAQGLVPMLLHQQ